MFSKWKYLFYTHDSICAIEKQIKMKEKTKFEKNKIVIDERLSVAQSIVKVIGAGKREDGYLEGNGILLVGVGCIW